MNSFIKTNWLIQTAWGTPEIQRFIHDYTGEECVGIANSFDIKEQLKSLGFRWYGNAKLWYVTEEAWAAVHPQVEAIMGITSSGPSVNVQEETTSITPPQAAPQIAIEREIRKGLHIGRFFNEYMKKNCIGISGAFLIKDELKNLGFRWDNEGKVWYVTEDRWPDVKDEVIDLIMRDSRLKRQLEDSKIPGLSEIQPDVTQPSVEEPVVEPEKVSSQIWYLATRKDNNLFTAFSEFKSEIEGGTSSIRWEDLDLNDGELLQEEFNALLEATPKTFNIPQMVKDQNGNYAPVNISVVTEAPTPDALLDPLKKIRDKNERAEEGDIKPDPYQQQAIDAFAQTNDHIMMNALAGTGKAQPLDALLLSTKGWIKMRDVSIKDKIFGSDGLPYEVKGVFPQRTKDVYKITFSDGSTAECCKDHLWETETRPNRMLCQHHGQPLFSRSNIVPTYDLINDLCYRGGPKHYIPMVHPIAFRQKQLLIDPYVMGAMLGDGCFRGRSIKYSTNDQEILDSISDSLPSHMSIRVQSINNPGCDYYINSSGKANPFVAELKNLGLWNKLSNAKFIPEKYKFNSIVTRIAVLQGLMDTDGGVDKRKGHHLEFSTTSLQLADDVSFIVQSLGGNVKIVNRITSYTYRSQKKNGQISYRVHIKLPSEIAPFRLRRKINNYKAPSKYPVKRSIMSIDYVGKKECQCISINSPDNLYVTNNCILTHNTSTLISIAKQKAAMEQETGKSSLWNYIVFNKKNQIEGDKKFEPYKVKVKTSHSFLGDVLKNSEIPGIPAGRGALWSPETAKKRYGGAHSRMSIILDNMMHGDDKYRIGQSNRLFQAKLMVQKIASLCKQFAIDPSDEKAFNDVNSIINLREFDTRLPTKAEEKAMERGEMPGAELVDFREEIVEDTVNLLGQCLPGNSDALHQSLKAQRRSEIMSARNSYQEGQAARGAKHLNHLKDMSKFRDHDDTLWYASLPEYRGQLKFPKIDVLLVDEVQDFNECQRRMLETMKINGTRIVAVGDKFQSIYGFRGADSHAFNNIRKLLQDSDRGFSEVALPINHRCGAAIVDWTNNNTEVMQNLPENERLQADKNHTEKARNVGKVTEGVPLESAFQMLADEWDSRGGQFKQKTAFISRTNAPLVSAAMQLMKAGVDFEILGKDISTELVDHLKIVTDDAKAQDGLPRWQKKQYDLEDFYRRIEDFHDKHTSRWAGQASKTEAVKELKEFTELLLQIIEYVQENGGYDPKYIDRAGRPMPIRDSYALTQYLKNRFSGLNVDTSEKDISEYEKRDKRKFVTLTTAHRSKGMEYSRVFILSPENFPSPNAKTKDELIQEYNAFYVACTRAEKNLIFTVSPEQTQASSDSDSKVQKIIRLADDKIMSSDVLNKADVKDLNILVAQAIKELSAKQCFFKRLI